MSSTAATALTQGELDWLIHTFRKGKGALDIPALLARSDSLPDEERWCIARTLGRSAGPGWPEGTCTSDHLRGTKPFLTDSDLSSLSPLQREGLTDFIDYVTQQVKSNAVFTYQPMTYLNKLTRELQSRKWYQSLGMTKSKKVRYYLAHSFLIKDRSARENPHIEEDRAIDILIQRFLEDNDKSSLCADAVELSYMGRFNLISSLKDQKRLTVDLMDGIPFLDTAAGALTDAQREEITTMINASISDKAKGCPHYGQAPEKIVPILQACDSDMLRLRASYHIAAEVLRDEIADAEWTKVETSDA